MQDYEGMGLLLKEKSKDAFQALPIVSLGSSLGLVTWLIIQGSSWGRQQPGAGFSLLVGVTLWV
jgi:hypothetical protein